MVLQLNEDLWSMVLKIRSEGRVRHAADAIGRPEKIALVMQHHAILDHGDIGLLDKLATGIPAWRFENDVVSLPFPGALHAFTSGGVCPYMAPH